MQNIFKRIGIAVMALSMFTLSSCDELKDLLKFNFDLAGEAIYIEVEAPISVGSAEELGSKSYDRSLAEILEEEAPGADMGKIKEINLTSITIEIVKGADDDNNFKNISGIEAEISAEGIATRVVGKVTNIPASATTKLEIPVTNGKINVRDYFFKNSFKYAVKGDVVKAITKDLELKVTANYSFVFGL